MIDIVEDLGFKVPTRSSTGKAYHYYLFKCQECTSGLVEATYDNYRRGLSTRCPECSFKARGVIHTKSQDTFIAEVTTLHPELDFSNTKYAGDENRVTFKCHKHGEVTMLATNLLQGKGCRQCGSDSTGAQKIEKASSTFIDKAIVIHGDANTYERFIYVNAKTPGLITCTIHGDYLKSPDKHLQGQGCPTCSNSGFSQSKPAILYYICIDNQYYKIGITNYDVASRFRDECEPSRLRIIKEWYYEIGSEALKQEVKIKREFKYALFKGDKILKNTGNTEIYTHDILQLD